MSSADSPAPRAWRFPFLHPPRAPSIPLDGKRNVSRRWIGASRLQWAESGRRPPLRGFRQAPSRAMKPQSASGLPRLAARGFLAGSPQTLGRAAPGARFCRKSRCVPMLPEKGAHSGQGDVARRGMGTGLSVVRPGEPFALIRPLRTSGRWPRSHAGRPPEALPRNRQDLPHCGHRSRAGAFSGRRPMPSFRAGRGGPKAANPSGSGGTAAPSAVVGDDCLSGLSRKGLRRGTKGGE